MRAIARYRGSPIRGGESVLNTPNLTATPSECALLLAIESAGFGETCSHQRFMLEDLRGRCREGVSSGWADPDGAKLIKAFVVGLSRVATRQHANELLANQHVEVVRTDLCNAYVTQIDDDSVIFVFRGLIKAIMFVLEFGDIVASLDARLKTGQQCPYSPDELHVLVYEAYSSLYHYEASGEPLPRAGGILRPGEKRSLLIRFSRVIWFVLMHEIGHVQLGHLCPGTVKSSLPGPQLVVSENLNSDKLQEFEADLFLCETLADSEQYAVLSYVLAPLDLLASLERNLREGSETHPSAVNRLQHILTVRYSLLDDASRDLAAEVVSRNVATLKFQSGKGSASRVQVTLQQSRDALRKLKEFYEDVAEIADDPSEGDIRDAALWDFALSYFWHDGVLGPSGRVPNME